MSTVEWEAKRSELDQMFEKAAQEQIANLPDYEMPELLSHLHLYNHQKNGIRWLVHQERDVVPPYFLEKKEGGQRRWQCNITKVVQLAPPAPVRGGILADGKWRHFLCFALF